MDKALSEISDYERKSIIWTHFWGLVGIVGIVNGC
jgi:hypothetical protein